MGIFEREKIAEIDERAQEQRQNREYLVRSNKRAGKRERKKEKEKKCCFLLIAWYLSIAHVLILVLWRRMDLSVVIKSILS